MSCVSSVEYGELDIRTGGAMDPLLQEIDELRTAVHQGAPCPHKYVFLLAVADILERDPLHSNRFPLDGNLEDAFRSQWSQKLPDLAVGQIEYPYYHLSSHSFWVLSIWPGKKEAFDAYVTQQASHALRFTRGRLQETVEYACLSTELYDMLRTGKGRESVRRIAESRLKNFANGGSFKGSTGRQHGMTLDTQSFALKKNWLSAAFAAVADTEGVFGRDSLDAGRKAFLAGKNQLAAIRNWLACGEVIDVGRGVAALTNLGQLMSAQDPKARHAVTWWLLHLHLCANVGAFPYSTYFTQFDVDGNWITIDDVVKRLLRAEGEEGETRSEGTVETYFAGVESAFRPGEMLSAKRVLRRTSVIAPDILVLYAALLFQSKFFSNQATVGTPDLLKAGLSKALGMKDKDFREALSRIHHNKDYAGFVQYRKQVNLDSVQFLKQGDAALRPIRTAAYKSGQVQWI
jgi:hypothetical protein